MSTVMARRTLATVVAGMVVGWSGTAHAAQIKGTPGNDRIHGTRGADVIDGLAGDDRVGAGKGPDTLVGGEGSDRLWGRWGADRLFGGPGNDRLWGGLANDQSWGDAGDDVMGGGDGNDRQAGGAGNDLIYAARGQDESWGEDGDDTLWAMARRDVHGPNDVQGDVLHGGLGNDTFRTRDGEQDTVDCGPGIDTAYVDFKDVLANPGECEVVNRARRAQKGEDRPESAEPQDILSPRE